MQVDLQHPALVALRESNISFNVCGPHIELDGFGKAGIVKITAQNDIDGLLLHSRYERVVPIQNMQDIVDEAWYWLRVTISKMGGVYAPHENWREAFIRCGYLPEGWEPYKGVTREQWEAGEEKRKCCMSA